VNAARFLRVGRRSAGDQKSSVREHGVARAEEVLARRTRVRDGECRRVEEASVIDTIGSRLRRVVLVAGKIEDLPSRQERRMDRQDLGVLGRGVEEVPPAPDRPAEQLP
jgi:hypothetical protein